MVGPPPLKDIRVLEFAGLAPGETPYFSGFHDFLY